MLFVLLVIQCWVWLIPKAVVLLQLEDFQCKEVEVGGEAGLSLIGEVVCSAYLDEFVPKVLDDSVRFWNWGKSPVQNYFVMPHTILTRELVRRRDTFRSPWKYRVFLYQLRKWHSQITHRLAFSPLAFVAGVEYVQNGDSFALCVVAAYYAGAHCVHCRLLSTGLMLATTWRGYHPLVAFALASIEFQHGTFGRRQQHVQQRSDVEAGDVRVSGAHFIPLANFQPGDRGYRNTCFIAVVVNLRALIPAINEVLRLHT